jgi:multisubunit Na+/H+ antiporter MnhC subunit
MPLSSIMILSAVVFAFTLFAVVLAWCDFYTRGASKSKDQQLQSAPNEENRLKNVA